jgi:hypothetical protein
VTQHETLPAQRPVLQGYSIFVFAKMLFSVVPVSFMADSASGHFDFWPLPFAF